MSEPLLTEIIAALATVATAGAGALMRKRVVTKKKTKAEQVKLEAAAKEKAKDDLQLAADIEAASLERAEVRARAKKEREYQEAIDHAIDRAIDDHHEHAGGHSVPFDIHQRRTNVTHRVKRFLHQAGHEAPADLVERIHKRVRP